MSVWDKEYGHVKKPTAVAIALRAACSEILNKIYHPDTASAASLNQTGVKNRVIDRTYLHRIDSLLMRVAMLHYCKIVPPPAP